MNQEQAEAMAREYLKDIFGPKDAREQDKINQLAGLLLSVAGVTPPPEPAVVVPDEPPAPVKPVKAKAKAKKKVAKKRLSWRR